MNVETAREYIKAGWYVDSDKRRMRLDSYGIPKGERTLHIDTLATYHKYKSCMSKPKCESKSVIVYMY